MRIKEMINLKSIWVLFYFLTRQKLVYIAKSKFTLSRQFSFLIITLNKFDMISENWLKLNIFDTFINIVKTWRCY